MIKKLLILFIFIGSTSLLNAHCGSCGVGDEKKMKSHSHIEKENTKETSIMDKLNLSTKQLKKYKSIKSKYVENAEKIEKKCTKELLALLNDNQKEIYSNSGVTCL